MSAASTTSYLVNGLGQRVKKSNASDTYFAYDEAGHLLGQECQQVLYHVRFFRLL